MTFTPVDTSRVFGIDISHWDGNVNLALTKSRGASFVFIKGMDGALITRYFVDNRQRAVDAGLLQAPYGWLYRDRDVSCVSQATAFSELVHRYPADLPPVIDLEWTYFNGIKTYPDYTDLEKWVNKWLLLNNRKPILYSSAGYMNALGRMPDALKNKFSAFWFANYGASAPALPFGFTMCQFWQFSASGDAQYYAPGDRGKLELDLNYWQGNLQSLYEFAGQQAPTEPGETTMQYRVVWPDGARKRTAPTTTNSYTAYFLQVGAIANVVQDNIPDATYPDNANMRWAKLDDGYFVATDYPSGGMPQDRMVLVEPVAVKVPFTITQTVKIDGFAPYTYSHNGELEKA